MVILEELFVRSPMSLVIESNFQHILRMLNTNIDGRQKVMYALTAIKGVGRRFSNVILKKADIDLSKRYANDIHGNIDLVFLFCTPFFNSFYSFFSF